MPPTCIAPFTVARGCDVRSCVIVVSNATRDGRDGLVGVARNWPDHTLEDRVGSKQTSQIGIQSKYGMLYTVGHCARCAAGAVTA